MAILSKKHIPFLYALVAFVAALLLYWPSLTLPLIYDDLLHIRITGELNLLSVWLPTESFGFYRPLTFLPLLLIEQLFGRYPPMLLHGLNVFQHAINAALLVLLAWRLWHRAGRALAAGLLLAFFPFSYQAIAVYGHNVHPTTAGIMLLALHTYLNARRGVLWSVGPWQPGRRFWWGVTGLLFLLGFFSHESAVLFGPYAFLMEWVLRGRSPIRRRKPFSAYLRAPWFIFSLLGLLYLVGYQLLPLSRAPQADAAGGAWLAKALYLLQAAAYAIVWPARFLPQAAGPWLIMTSVLLLLLLLFISARTPRNRPALLMGIGWWGLASLLLALPLSADYLLHGPRLLYLSSIGLALLWPILLVPFARLARPLPALLLAIILLQNALFVREKLQVYRALTSPVMEVAQVMAERPDEEGFLEEGTLREGLLLVNLPQWMAPAKNSFPAGVEIASILGDYLFVEELIADNLGVDYPVHAVVLPELLSRPAGYNYGVHDQTDWQDLSASWPSAGQHVFLVHYGEDGPVTSYTGMINPASPEREAIASFSVYDLLSVSAEACADQLFLFIDWRPTSEASASPTTSVFVQLFDGDGALLTQADGPPLGLRPDRLALDESWELHDRRVLPLEPESRAGTLLIGVYDFASGTRYPATAAGGEPLPDDALNVPIRACQDEDGD